MSFSDIIKNSVLEKFQAGDLTTTTVVLTLAIAVAAGLFIYLVYRLNSRSGFYNRDFNKSLATLPVITAGIMLAMGSNLTISLGMVGALSIVRFRNAVKDAADLTYLFWSISAGIVIGAGLFELAFWLSLVVAVLTTFLDLLPVLRAPCLLVVSAQDLSAETALMKCVGKFCRRYQVRSRNVTKRGVEWIVEMQVRQEGELLQSVSALPQIQSLHLMTHDGDVRF